MYNEGCERGNILLIVLSSFHLEVSKLTVCVQ